MICPVRREECVYVGCERGGLCADSAYEYEVMEPCRRCKRAQPESDLCLGLCERCMGAAEQGQYLYCCPCVEGQPESECTCDLWSDGHDEDDN